MKHVMGISLGPSRRDHSVTIELMGEKCKVERIGTDGDIRRMIRIIEELDGRVDAFGLGGISLSLYTLRRRYELRDAKRIMRAAQKTPIVDGSGIKNTLEKRVINELAAGSDILGKEKKVLLMCALDRFGMARALEETGSRIYYGDLPFTLGVPLLFTSLKTISFVAALLLPLFCRLPFSMIYPSGGRQEENRPRFRRYFDPVDVIAGDFPLIYRFMPRELDGKTVITNTITSANIEELRNRGLRTLVTTTPDMDGRSFGTNVIEALLVSLSGKNRALTEEEYNRLLSGLSFPTRVIQLQEAPLPGAASQGPGCQAGR